jgi:hypothetical protein
LKSSTSWLTVKRYAIRPTSSGRSRHGKVADHLTT